MRATTVAQKRPAPSSVPPSAEVDTEGASPLGASATPAPPMNDAQRDQIFRQLVDTRSDAAQWFQSIQNMPPDTHFAIEVGGRVAGSIGAVAGQGVFAKTAEFGYWLGEKFWGRGIATQAAVAYSRYIMRAMAFHRLQSYVFAWNSASMRVLVKAGFSHDATFKRSAFKDGTIVDEWVYGLTDEQLASLGDSTKLRLTASGFSWEDDASVERLPSVHRNTYRRSSMQEDSQRDRQLIRI